MSYKMRKFEVVIQTEVYDETGARHGYYPLVFKVKAKTAKNAALCMGRHLKKLHEKEGKA